MTGNDNINEWSQCRHILCIRADNMGDLLMSSPAIRALKESFGCKITVLTSSMAAAIAGYIDCIDDVITYDLPWVKTNAAMDTYGVYAIIEKLKVRRFDAAVIFTVYSQNPLPAAMLAYLANIPIRLAYCRENPYQLLTHWVPDKEPYTFIQHQVKRDLNLVASAGAATDNNRLSLQLPVNGWEALQQKLTTAGVNCTRPWLICHAGVSEKKREYPEAHWVETAKQLIAGSQQQVLFTGAESEKIITDRLQQEVGHGSFSLAGQLSLEEFILLISRSPLLISVNTGPVHIAAATGTPVIVLYALTNPQHLPWKVTGKALLFDTPENGRSKNEVVKHVHDQLMYVHVPIPMPGEIIAAARELLACTNEEKPLMPEMIPLKDVSAE